MKEQRRHVRAFHVIDVGLTAGPGPEPWAWSGWPHSARLGWSCPALWWWS